MANIVYTTFSGNTESFVSKFKEIASVYEIDATNPIVENNEPYILIVPSYEDEYMYEHVLDFLETGSNSENCKGVMGSGNMNFKSFGLYGITAKRISEEFSIKLLRIFELRGGRRDIEFLKQELKAIEYE